MFTVHLRQCSFPKSIWFGFFLFNLICLRPCSHFNRFLHRFDLLNAMREEYHGNTFNPFFKWWKKTVRKTLIVCSHWLRPIPRPIKWLSRDCVEYSDCPETDTNTDSHWVLYHFIGLGLCLGTGLGLGLYQCERTTSVNQALLLQF